MKYKFPIKDVEESTLKSVLVNDGDNFRITHSQLAALRLAVK